MKLKIKKPDLSGLKGKLKSGTGKLGGGRLTSRIKESRKAKIAVGAIAVIAILVLVSFAGLIKPTPKPIVEDIELPDNYIIFLEEPDSEEEAMIVAMSSCLSSRDGVYFPMFILENGKLNSHQLYTIGDLKIGDWTPLVISSYESTEKNLSGQLKGKEIMRLDACPYTFNRLQGYSGGIPVSTYEEALWASPIAALSGKKLIYGEPEYETQEDAWAEVKELNPNVDYVVITNPHEFGENITHMEAYMQFHIPALSSVAAELAAYHGAPVITVPDNASKPLSSIDETINGLARGYYTVLKDRFYPEFSDIEYVALVGSATAVPQFQLRDLTGHEMDYLVASDSVYGFLDKDPNTMDVAVGRIINLNAAGASNSLVRTFLVNKLVDTKTINFESGPQQINWKKHASVWNGFEVADQRMQMTPGFFITKDFDDEGINSEYMRTNGKGGIVGDNSRGEDDFREVMESGMYVAYRGHGNVYGTFYVYDWDESGYQGYTKLSSEELRTYNLPPQIFMSASCLNGKVWGRERTAVGVVDLDVTRLIPPNYFYAGAVGLYASTEVSYSRIGQDIFALRGEITGDHDWDKNNAMYAVFYDALLNHEDKYGTLGKAGQWAINRYISNHDNSISPLSDAGDTIDWKEVAMYCVFGDPAYQPPGNNPGAGSYDPWHNGGDDDVSYIFPIAANPIINFNPNPTDDQV